tara:strand:- start:74 stop:271 length:198 start_codon:yes stop_codon:yes gene_type:complete
MQFLTILIITILMISFVFAGIGIKILLKKNGSFSGTCASQNPLINNQGEVCSFCGAEAEDKCKNK